MRPEPTSRYWPRSNELRVAGHYWLSRGGSVYASEASEASAEILTSRIGQEGPDSERGVTTRVCVCLLMLLFICVFTCV